MDQSVISPFDQIKACIAERQSFVLQGGAGSGKTESLKRTVQFCAENHPDKKIVCITHTNKAVDEIIARVGSEYDISTIHSFLNKLLTSYKRNLLQMLPELFCLPHFERVGVDGYGGDEKAQKKQEHERFKKLHASLENMRSIVLSEDTDKVVGKREYDKNPEKYNDELNKSIEALNVHIRSSLEQRNYQDVKYNETSFDSFKDATFGHDGLIKLTAILLKKYPNFGRIVRDKFDCIFIDEYQDTDEQIIRGLIYDTPDEHRITVGLFGDSEQAIYEDGIGSAMAIVDDGKLKLIEKEDNYRCSPQVIDIANKFRTDGLRQKVALKEQNGQLENDSDREGFVKLFYAQKPDKPSKDSSNAEREAYKEEYARRLSILTQRAKEEVDSHVILKLPNRAVANDASFGTLFGLFNERYRDPREEIKKHLDRLQFGQLSEVLRLFESSSEDKTALNKLISKLKRLGFSIKTRKDKQHLYNELIDLLNSNKPAYEVMQDANKSKIISISESHEAYLKRKDSELDRIANEQYLAAFKALKREGSNTELQMLKHISENEFPDLSLEIIKEQFDDRMRDIQIQDFYTGLFGGNLKFSEILAFYRYEDDDSNFMTMHKTKGTGIENVIVVLDEFNWTKYDFASCFEAQSANPSRQAISRKLLYVACSRTKKNLVCVRLVDGMEEVRRMEKYFDNCEQVKP